MGHGRWFEDLGPEDAARVRTQVHQATLRRRAGCQVWERNHWYEQGTDSAKSGWAVVGENGPELVNLSGGEQIHNAAESRKLLAENRTFIPHTGAGFDAAAIGSSIAAEIKNNQFTPSELAKALDGVPVSLVVDGKQMQAHISTTVSGIAVGAGRAH